MTATATHDLKSRIERYVTGVPAGVYTLRITINKGDKKGPMMDEGQNRYPNVYETKVNVPDPRNKVEVVTD